VRHCKSRTPVPMGTNPYDVQLYRTVDRVDSTYFFQIDWFYVERYEDSYGFVPVCEFFKKEERSNSEFRIRNSVWQKTRSRGLKLNRLQSTKFRTQPLLAPVCDLMLWKSFHVIGLKFGIEFRRCVLYILSKRFVLKAFFSRKLRT
jgi:hypothetical protein